MRFYNIEDALDEKSWIAGIISETFGRKVTPHCSACVYLPLAVFEGTEAMTGPARHALQWMPQGREYPEAGYSCEFTSTLSHAV